MTSIQFNKKIIIFVIAIIMLLAFSNSSFAIVSQTREFYVNDSANLLEDDTKEYIINMNKKLEEKTGAQIVVVTIQNLEGKSLEEYATELFREYGIGDKDKNNGVLLLCALEEREFRIEVGYGLEGVLTDGKTGRIQDSYIIPYLKDNNFNEGIKNGFNAILTEVENEYGITIDGAETEVTPKSVTITRIFNGMLILIFVLACVLTRGRVLLFFLGGNSSGDSSSSGGFSSGGSSGGFSGGGGSSRSF